MTQIEFDDLVVTNETLKYGECKDTDAGVVGFDYP